MVPNHQPEMVEPARRQVWFFRVSIKSWGVDQGEACCVPKSNLSLVHPWNKVPLFL